MKIRTSRPSPVAPALAPVGSAASALGSAASILASAAFALGLVALSLFAVGWGAFAFRADAQAPALDDPLPPDPDVVAGTLDNGLRYFIRENGQPENRAVLRLVVNVGSIVEDEDQLGLAHFVEHMAFNGTRHFEKSALVDYLESIGMAFGPHINAYTSFDETVYMLQLPMDDPEVLANGFQILQDWAAGQLFDPEEVDKERGVVVEEWRGRRGAMARIQDQQVPVLFEGSLYAERLPIGKPEVLETAPPETLRRFFDDWYRPSLMAVVAVGDFDAAQIEAMVEEYFGGLRDPDSPRPRTTAEVPLDHPARVTIATDPEMPQTQVALLHKLPPQGLKTVADFRRGLVQELYSGMLNARLEELRLQADPPFVFAGTGRGSFVRGMDAYQMVAFVTEDGVERGMDALLTEAERVARHGFTASELERQKAEAARSYERQLAAKETRESAALAARYIRVYLEGRAYPSIDTEAALAQALLPGVTLEETNALVSEGITEEGRVVLVGAPEKEGLETPSEDALTELFAAVAARDVAAYEDAAVDAPLLPETPTGAAVASEEVVEAVGVTVWTLENGVRVVLKPTDFKDDEIRFAATSPGGTSLAADEVFESADVAVQVVGDGGVGEFDQAALQKKLAGTVVDVSPTIGGLSEGFRGSASPKDLETALQLVYLYFTAPRKDEGALGSFKAQMAGFFANASSNPDMVFADTVSTVMSQDHPRAGAIPDPEDVEKVDLDDAFAFYQERFADAGDFTFYFAGAFDMSAMRPLVEQYLGALPSVGREETWRDVGIDPPPGVVERVVRMGVEPQSRTQIIFAGDGEYSLRERGAVAALADVLEIRLRELLREDLGGTYGVGVSGSLSYRPDEEYRVSIGFGSAPERADELAAVVFEEIERLKADGPDTETVAKVRETQRRAKETSLRENSYWINQMRSFDQQGRDYAEIPSYDLIEAWSAADVRAAAQRYLRLDQYAKFVLLPEGPVS